MDCGKCERKPYYCQTCHIKYLNEQRKRNKKTLSANDKQTKWLKTVLPKRYSDYIIVK